MAKDAVYAMVGHLTDAFLISTVPIATESERRRNSNPRKVYPLDPGLIGAFDTSGRSNVGHALETVVQTELLRRKADLSYVKTAKGFEVDFLARFPGDGEDLIQVCANPAAADTLNRELRALEDAAPDYPGATRRLLLLTRDQVPPISSPDLLVQPAYEWLLATPD